MARYSDTIRDERTLAPVAEAQVYVRNQDGSTPVITSDSGAPIPYAVSDEYGVYSFNALSNFYDLIIRYRGRVVAEIFGVAIGTPTLPTGFIADVIGTSTTIAPSQRAVGQGLADAAEALATASGGDSVGYKVTSAAPLRTVASRFRDRVSIRDFGALGNGIHDDTSAFSDAIAYLKAGGGGAIYVPPGTYKITGSIVIDSPCISLRGSGRSSVIQGVGAFDTLVIDGAAYGLGAMYRNNASDLHFDESGKTGGRCFYAREVAQIRVRDLSFDDPYDGMVFNHYNDVLLDEVVFQGPLRVEGGQRLLLTSPVDTTSDVFTIRNCGFGGRENYSGAPGTHVAHGVVIDGWCNTVTIIKSYAVLIEGYAYWVTNRIGATNPPGFLTFQGAESDFCARDGIYFERCAGARVTDCQLEDSWNAPGITIGPDAFNIDIKGGQINDNGRDGIFIAGTRVSVNGVNIYSNSSPGRGGTAGLASGVYLSPDARDIIINGNQIGPGTASASQAYGVVIDAAADGFAVTGNNLRGNATGAINNSAGTGPSKIVANNAA